MLPKVSVVIPYYNEPAEFLSRALTSVLAQDYANIEPIVVDDCSRVPFCGLDKHPDFRDRPVVWRRQPENRKLPATRNAGVRAATGSLICFLDSDDWWEPTKLSRQVAQLRESPPNVGLFYTGTVHHYPDGRTEIRDARHSGDISGEMMLRQAVNGPSTVMIPKAVFEELGLFDERFRICDDREMWLRISLRFEARAIDEPLVHLTKRQDSLSADSLKTVAEGRQILEMYRETIRERGLWRRAISTHEGKLAKIYLADRKPVERKFVLVLTVFPVITGLIVSELLAVRDGFLPFASVVPTLLLQLALSAFFVTAYLRFRD